MAKKNEVAATVESKPPVDLAELGADIGDFEGAGVSTKAEDNLIPIVTLLQDLSPQVKDRNPEYVEGAKPGMFYIKSLNLLIDGTEGFHFQPCDFRTAWNEWVPRDKGGGLVNSFPEFPKEIAVEVINDKGKKVWQSSDKNDLIETRYHAGLLYYEDQVIPAVMAFSSTGHTVSRSWMVLMNNAMIGQKKAPSWFKKYHIKSRIKQKNNHEWFLPEIADAEWITDKALRDVGRSLHLAMQAGDKKIDAASADQTTEKVSDEMPF